MTPPLTPRAADIPDGYWVDCWNCGGEGFVFDRFDGFCVDAEYDCGDCARKCDVCHGKGGWYADEPDEPHTASREEG